MVRKASILREYIRAALTCYSMISEELEAHILNFYEDLEMPLSEIYEVIDAIGEGNLEDIQEKMDGQNVTFTVINRTLQFFSKGPDWNRVQRGGMNREAIEVKYQDRPSVRDAFLMAYDALNQVTVGDPENANKLFQDGKVVVETALLAPKNPNTIMYEEPHIRFIQVAALEPNASVDESAYQKFLTDAEAAVDQLDQKVNMGAVPLLKLKRALDADQVMSDLKSQLDDVISDAGVSRNDTVGDLSIRLVINKLERLDIPSEIREKAAYRLVTGDKKALTKKDVIKTAGLETWKAFQALEKDRGTIMGRSLIPIERIIQNIGIHAFRNIDFALASNKTESGEELRQFVRDVRLALKQGRILTDPVQLDRIKAALDRVGDNEELFEKAVEGIVFQWKGKTRKLTGLFTPINKLRGFFYYGSSPAKIQGIKEERLRHLIRAIVSG